MADNCLSKSDQDWILTRPQSGYSDEFVTLAQVSLVNRNLQHHDIRNILKLFLKLAKIFYIVHDVKTSMFVQTLKKYVKIPDKKILIKICGEMELFYFSIFEIDVKIMHVLSLMWRHLFSSQSQGQLVINVSQILSIRNTCRARLRTVFS